MTFPPPSGDDWQWGGCSDNIDFGVRMSQQFLDHVPLNMPMPRTLLRLHNNQAGREVCMRVLLCVIVCMRLLQVLFRLLTVVKKVSR